MLQVNHSDRATPKPLPAHVQPPPPPRMKMAVTPETDEARRFIEVYDVIRSDKAGPLSRHEMDWSFLATRFGTLFEITRIDGVLSVASSASFVGRSTALKGPNQPLTDFLPDRLAAEISRLFDELTRNPNSGILARLGDRAAITPREYELVLLPTAKGGLVTAIGIIALVSGPAISGAGLSEALVPTDGLRLEEKNCFDLRQRMLLRFGGFLNQCIANMTQMLPGREHSD